MQSEESVDKINEFSEEPVTILDFLVADLKKRQETLRADRNRHTFYLKEVDPNWLMELGYLSLLAGLQKKSTLVEILATIGRQVRANLKLPMESVLEVHTGWFVLISFLELDIINYYTQKFYYNNRASKYPMYHVGVRDWNALNQLMVLVDKKNAGTILPTNTPPARWVSAHHESGATIVKKMHSSIRGLLSPQEQPILFNNLNKLQETGWRIAKETLNVYEMCLRQATGKRPPADSPFKFSSEEDENRKASLTREAETICGLAKMFLNDPFYHTYNYDFRYRLYVMTAYLHEQSSDNAKGLLLFDQGVPFGDQGLYWFKIHMSNVWGHDKDTKEGRVKFTSDHVSEWIEYAKSPLINRGWMKADAPFSFLTCCFELKKLRDWIIAGNSIESFVSHVPCYIDGSTNGTQHLTAMSKDESIAHLVNLVPTALPGDLYMYIAGHAWASIREAYEATPQATIDCFDSIWAEGKRLHKLYADSPRKSEQRALAYSKVSEWRNHNRSIREALFPVYWMGVNNPKDQRKAVKRPVMTLG